MFCGSDLCRSRYHFSFLKAELLKDVRIDVDSSPGSFDWVPVSRQFEEIFGSCFQLLVILRNVN
jgi:hypothetical protein